MKTLSIVSLASAIALSAQAELIRFQLSPPGTDVAVGLSPSNEVPPSATSTGSGGEISGGIVLDTDTSILHMAVGYGSAAGFTDLTGPATAMHIHGPATNGENAGVMVSLVPYSFPAVDPAKGGVIVGDVPWPADDTAALLAGHTYLNVHTAAYPGGEIRGQLVPVNEAPVVVCPASEVLECGSEPTTLVALFSDPEGDPLSVLWSINGMPVATNSLPARAPGLPTMDMTTQQLPLGTNVVEVMAVDAAGNMVSCSTLIPVLDSQPPVITAAAAQPDVLWPPNHKLVPVTVRAVVTDACSTARWKIVRVSSNERINGRGDGNTSPDWVITGDHTVSLRAERAGGGNGRVYSIVLRAWDAAGNVSATKVVRVTVPKSASRLR